MTHNGQSQNGQEPGRANKVCDPGSCLLVLTETVWIEFLKCGIFLFFSNKFEDYRNRFTCPV